MNKDILLNKVLFFVFLLTFSSSICLAKSIHGYHNIKYNSEIQAGPLCYYLDYQERENGKVLDKDYGLLYGIQGKVNIRNGNNIFSVESFIAYTDFATYEGAYGTGEYISSNNEKECIFILQTTTGYTFNPGIEITPYLGLGYRYWRRGEAKVIQLADGSYVWDYKEIYSWAYITSGIKFSIPIINNVSLALDAAYMFAIDPQVTAYFSEIDPYFPNITLNLNPKSAFYINIPIKIKLNRRLLLHIEGIFRYWNMGRSNFYLGMYEPHSITKLYGINIGIGYKF